jgi:hypothetical protein
VYYDNHHNLYQQPGSMGVALLPAATLDDGSFDNCGPVTFRARRMDNCIDFDWTHDGSDLTPDGDVDIYDQD